MIERSFKIGVNAGFSVAPVIHVNQYDHDEVWYFTLIQEDGQVYAPSTGSIVGVKADGNVIINSGTVNSSGQIVINETQQMTAAVGNAVYELVFDAGTHGTANFIVRVEPKPGDNATVSDSDISLIEEAIVMGSRIVAYGSPLVATAASQMTNRQNVYVYTGSESGYTNGHWYYWNGSAWTDGGVYNAVAVNTDKTLSVENMAADGKATGDAIADLKNAITKTETALNAVYPNLWDCSYADDTANGITFRKNSDGTYNVTGTATALFYKQQSITLPAGVYYIYGFSDGATSTHHIMIGGLGSNAYQSNRWVKITLTAETEITLTMRVMSGTSVNATFKPMVVTEAYNGINFVPYGSAYFAKTVDEKINAVEELTGYTKPNLFNNTISSQTANGLTFTVNEDKSITITGTATALSAPNKKMTLPRGKYILNGCNGGSSQQYHLAILKAGSSTFSAIQYGGTDYPFEITEDTQEVTLYVRVMSGVTVNDTVYPMVRSASVYNPTYAPYGEYQVYKPIQQLIDYTQFNWSGKKMNVIGDSIVQGSYGNFIIPIRDILNLSEARNYGVGGSCLASSDADAQYPPAVLRYTSMDTDAQIIIVHAGTNDYSAQIPLGADDSTDITTFNGALNVMMTGLREMYPTALIIFDSILHRFNDGELPIKASQYRACIENRCLANHIVFYDAYKYSGFDFVKGYYDHILTGDGLHPNQTGANILGRKLAGFIRWN